MNEDEFMKVRDIFKKGSLQEIKKIKKEDLINFINKWEEKDAATQLELETAQLHNDNFSKLMCTLEEYRGLIKELREKHSNILDELSSFKKRLQESEKQLKVKKILLVTSVIVNFILAISLLFL